MDLVEFAQKLATPISKPKQLFGVAPLMADLDASYAEDAGVWIKSTRKYFVVQWEKLKVPNQSSNHNKIRPPVKLACAYMRPLWPNGDSGPNGPL